MWEIALGIQIAALIHMCLTWHEDSKFLHDRLHEMSDEFYNKVLKTKFRIQIAISILTGALASQLFLYF